MAERTTAPAPDVSIGSITLRAPGIDPSAGERIGREIGAGLASLDGGRIELGAIVVRVSSVDEIVPAVLRAASRSRDARRPTDG